MSQTRKRAEVQRTTSRRGVLPLPPTPPLLRDYMDGAVELVRELEARYHGPPLMSLFRTPDSRDGVRVAVLATQDGAATLTVELDTRSGAVEWAYRLGSMLGQRFVLRELSDMDRTHWLTLMRDGEPEPAFLWSAARWQGDYLICSTHRYYVNVFAFSPQHAEAAARLTPEAARKLFDWLEAGWFPPAPDETTLTW